ncbi:hypothetical protein [Clostridium botulinum]|uniref:Uncharacterized protein n=1 Tax=Clostridium botulinum TaxID=1491 RepID=A0A9Q1ZAL6_CLOBO|nr:hypothetical protein [Clostridium botulinum]KEI04270.1 hypothetical protein Y848_02370 [Clostridium botulinum C/D str. Sp77]KLU75788.1 hypothetical protein CBC3_06700 [Clostridium botulinum V891]KOA73150.1 hypothetical protein ADU78_13295 [Clostridium botulinum]KOA74996.1 hypothetical protein ADU77_11335 [Clostridium botulinum]KOA84839.1 hypothetical protein ADU74_10640 [Clostridium botulinum]
MSYKYNNYYYWKNVLCNKKEVWKCSIMNTLDLQESIYINTTILDYDKNTLDNNWACYPNIKALLGFIQYIYLPTAFFYIVNADNNDDIFMPICSTEEFIEYIKETGYNESIVNIMEQNLNELISYWNRDELSINTIKKFCYKFNNIWNNEKNILYINVFSNPREIADFIIKNEDFIEVVEEDIGLSKNQFYNLCENIYYNKFTKNIFVEFLNNKIGCIV